MDRKTAGWLAVWAIAVVLLLTPAIYNRFPLMFPDSYTYLNIAYGDFWTLDRSAFYGFFLKPLGAFQSGLTALWLAISVQAAIVATILIGSAKRIAPRLTPVEAIGALTFVVLGTTLPWHVGQIMPDAFTGALILLPWLAASRDPSKTGSPLLWFTAAFLTVIHYTHMAIFCVTVTITLGCARFFGEKWREIGKRAFAAILVVATALSANIAANGLLFGRWAATPMGGWFLFARVHEDGLAQDWLDRHCGMDAPKAVCDIRHQLPRDSQIFLWDVHSPLHPFLQDQIASPTFWRWSDMLSAAAHGAIKEEPVRFLKNSIIAGGHQFLTFDAVDDQCPEVCTPDPLIAFRPDVERPIRASRQLNGSVDKSAIRSLAGTIETLALLLVLPFVFAAYRRRDREALTLLLTIAACLVVNSVVTGALSDVQPRYQSRIIWLPVFAEILIVFRWLDRRPRPISQSASTPEGSASAHF